MQDIKLIAACGMNCMICKAHLREKNRCPGCNYLEEKRPKTRTKCMMRRCAKRSGRFCYDCKDFPCEILVRLDKRYRAKYGMSEIENLEYIRDKGIKKFIEKESEKWISQKGILCVHDKKNY